MMATSSSSANPGAATAFEVGPVISKSCIPSLQQDSEKETTSKLVLQSDHSTKEKKHHKRDSPSSHEPTRSKQSDSDVQKHKK